MTSRRFNSLGLPQTSIPSPALSDFRLEKLTQRIDCVIVAVDGGLGDHEIEPVLEGDGPREIERTQPALATPPSVGNRSF
jgi:hypothetical protein